MQNKPNFQKSQMNVSILLQMDYENKRNWTFGESKPNSNPISKKPKMNVNLYVIEDYRKKDDFAVRKNKPKQTQFYLPPGEPALLALRSFSEGGSAAEGGLATTFFGAFLQRAADRPEKNVDTMNVLVIKSYRIYLNRCLLLSNY